MARRVSPAKVALDGTHHILIEHMAEKPKLVGTLRNARRVRKVDHLIAGSVDGAGLARRFAIWRFRYAIWLDVIVTSSQPSSPTSLRTSTGRVL